MPVHLRGKGWLTFRDLVFIIRVTEHAVTVICARVDSQPNSRDPSAPDNLTTTSVREHIPVGRVIGRESPPAEIVKIHDPHLIKRTEFGYFTQPEFVREWFKYEYDIQTCRLISEKLILCLW